MIIIEVASNSENIWLSEWTGSPGVTIEKWSKDGSTAIISWRAAVWQRTEKGSADAVSLLPWHVAAAFLSRMIRTNGLPHASQECPTILGILLSGSPVTLHSAASNMKVSTSLRLNSGWKCYNWMICQVLNLILAALFLEPSKRGVPDVTLVYLKGNWTGKTQRSKSHCNI